MIKKHLITTLFLLLPLIIFAQKPKVVATASMIADMAENLAGEFIEVVSIVPIGGDPHIYEATPSDAILAANANLILRNGLTFEGWLNELLENSGTKADIITVTENIDVISSITYTNAPDPHAWMNAKNGIIYTENIKKALIKLLPEYESEILFNAKAYTSDLNLLDEYIHKRILEIPEKQRIIVTSHDAFQYYGRAYGLQLESILGTSTDAQAQTSDIVRLNKVLQESGIPSVFIETTVNPKLLQQLAEDNNIKIGGKLFSDSLGKKGGKGGTYIDMLKSNTDTIVEALKGKKAASPKEKEQKTNLAFWLIPIVLLIGILVFILFRKN